MVWWLGDSHSVCVSVCAGLPYDTVWTDLERFGCEVVESFCFGRTFEDRREVGLSKRLVIPFIWIFLEPPKKSYSTGNDYSITQNCFSENIHGNGTPSGRLFAKQPSSVSRKRWGVGNENNIMQNLTFTNNRLVYFPACHNDMGSSKIENETIHHTFR